MKLSNSVRQRPDSWRPQQSWAGLETAYVFPDVHKHRRHLVVLRTTVPIRTTTQTGLPLSHTRQIKACPQSKPSQDSLAPGKALKLRPRNQASCTAIEFFLPDQNGRSRPPQKNGSKSRRPNSTGVGCGSDLQTKNSRAKLRSLSSTPRIDSSINMLLLSAYHGETPNRDVQALHGSRPHQARRRGLSSKEPSFPIKFRKDLSTTKYKL